jgi:hypothetical protein
MLIMKNKVIVDQHSSTPMLGDLFSFYEKYLISIWNIK